MSADSPRRNWLLFSSLLLFGLVIRVLGGFLHGTQDMEFWKAYGEFTTQHGLLELYATVPDLEIIRQLREGKPRKEVRQATQRIIRYQPHDYFRTDYYMPQPPAYIYPIDASTRLYHLCSPCQNERLFNWFLNLEPSLSSGFLALALAWFVAQVSTRRAGVVVGLVYWLHPLVLLNAPIQGYRDPLVALFATLSLIALYQRRLALAVVFLVCGFMTKPQGVLIAPVVLWCGLCEHSWRGNLRAWAAGAAVGILICLPYLLAGRFVGVVQGVLSTTQTSVDLSRQAMNFWWPVQYLANVQELHASGENVWTALLGSNPKVFQDYPIAKFGAETGTRPVRIGLVLLIAFTLGNLWFTRKILRIDRRLLFLAAGMQVYGYFMLRPGVQINHYFLLVPLFTVVWSFGLIRTQFVLLLSAVLFLQDFLFYGLGRDWNFGQQAITAASLGWLTNLLALTNAGLFVYLCWQCWRLARNPPTAAPMIV